MVFGKLPAHGDFVNRHLDPASAGAWDGWFSRQIAQARETLGDDFPAAHGAAPAWRFVEAPGAFGPAWRAGAFAPSMDAAGRRFFLLVATGPLDRAEAGRGRALGAALEPVLYEALAECLTADAVAERAGRRLAALAVSPGDDGVAEPWWETLGGATLSPAAHPGSPEDVIGAPHERA